MQDLEDREFIEEYENGAIGFLIYQEIGPVVSVKQTTGIELSKVNEFLI